MKLWLSSLLLVIGTWVFSAPAHARYHWCKISHGSKRRCDINGFNGRAVVWR